MRRDHHGLAVVELAVLLPLLIFLFLVAVDFARVFYFSLTLTNCARAGALYASDPTTANESPFANVTAAALSDASDLSPAPLISTDSGTYASGQQWVSVTATYTFQTITGFPGIPTQINLRRTVTMSKSAATPNTN